MQKNEDNTNLVLILIKLRTITITWIGSQTSFVEQRSQAAVFTPPQLY